MCRLHQTENTTAMQRANAVALQFVDERQRDNEQPTGLMTPARWAGLEALEREFSDLLATYQSQVANQTAAA
jgi:hypothetical protein